MSHTSSATVKATSRKPLISKERLHDIMTKPLEGADEENKENTRANGLLDKREWARKETAEVSQRSIKPITKDPSAARRLISRGIKGISEHTIDDVGYRRLQGVIKEHDNIFIDEPKYDDMLLSLFTAIEQPDIEERRPLGRKNDSIFQMLVVLRLMLQHNRKYFAGYYPRAITALITARGNFQARSHIVSGFEQTAEDIIKVCQPSDVIDAVLMTLELVGKPVTDSAQLGHPQDSLDQDLLNEQSARSTAFGLHILSGLITRVQQIATELDAGQEQRMATLGMNCLRSTNVTVKRAVMEYCVRLHEIIEPESRFYKLLTDGVSDLENLIEYYVIASKASAITTQGRGITTEGRVIITERRSFTTEGKGISNV
jgi:CLIP-associating protein 1/2